MHGRILLASLTALIALCVVIPAAMAGKAPTTSTGLLPDLQTVVPTHLNLVNQQQHDYLRFSNGIANTGGGPWALRPQHALGSAPTTTAIQEIRSNGAYYKCGEQPKQVTDCYRIVAEFPTS